MEKKEVDLPRYYLKIFLQYKYVILISIILFSSIGFAFYKYEVPLYRSISHLTIGRETVGTSLDISNIQRAGEITTIATSYPIISQAISKLNITQYPVKKGLVEKLFSEEKEEYLDIRELTYYYISNTNVKSDRNNIITISVLSQYPEVARDLSNELGNLLIEQNAREKNTKIQASIGYIDSQLTSLKQLIQQNRKGKEENEASANYNEIMNLERKIETDQNTLALFLREQEHLRSSIDLSNESEEKSQYQTKMDYVKSRIEELMRAIDDDKARLNVVDKTEFYKAKDLEFAISTNEGIYINLIGEKQRIVLASLIESKDLRFLSRAFTPIRPDKVRGRLFILAFFGMGLVVAFGVIQLSEILNRRFKSVDDVEEKMELKVIGSVPKITKEDEVKLMNPQAHPKSRVVEAYRTLATNIKFAARGKKIKSIFFSSDKPETGKSYTIANLSSIMADSGNKILMVDVDLRRPKLHRIFNIARKPGLTDLLSGKAKLSKVLTKIKKNLYLIPSGSLSYNPQSIVESEAMKKLIKQLASKHKFVFYDSLPITAFSDAAILASETDASVLVINQKKSRKDTLELAKSMLDEINSPILGIVVNKIKLSSMKYQPYYYYYSPEKKPQQSFLSKFSGHKKSFPHKEAKSSFIEKLKKKHAKK